MNLYRERASSLAAQAVGSTLRKSQIAPGEITHLVTASCTGFTAPGVDHSIIQKFNLRADVERTHVGFMGCHAAVNVLRIAKALAQTPGSVVLICCVEISSIHLQPSPESEDLVGAALFSDGAASALVSREAPSGALEIGSSLSHYMPDGDQLMTWSIGDTGFIMRLDSQLPRFLSESLPNSPVGAWLKEAASIALHPGGGRLLRAVSEAVRLTPLDLADSAMVLSLFGNMSSPTPLFVLERLMVRKAPLPVAVLAFGPGLHAEGIALTSTR
jgi:predicted naringenin-chalcone synthase